MIGLEYFTPSISDSERQKEIEELTGDKLDGKIDYDAVDYTEWTQTLKREQARNEVVKYVTKLIMKEYNIDNEADALLKWDEYKIKHSINIGE